MLQHTHLPFPALTTPTFCSDIHHTDLKGRNALHFVATSESVHARKMVSLLMRRGSQVGELVCVKHASSHLTHLTDSLDGEMNSPLHIASDRGHTAIIIALVEEGGADVNSKGGERNDTPLMLTVSPPPPGQCVCVQCV